MGKTVGCKMFGSEFEENDRVRGKNPSNRGKMIDHFGGYSLYFRNGLGGGIPP